MEDINFSDMVEVPYTSTEPEGDGVLSVGDHGDTSEKAVMEKARKLKKLLAFVHYRECIPCGRCGECLEMRGFNRAGQERVKALYCLRMEFETDEWHSCINARMGRKGRKKVVYDLTNAPANFKVGGKTIANVREEVAKYERMEDERIDARIANDGYMGGSGVYQRADGKKELKGSGEMPKGLMN